MAWTNARFALGTVVLGSSLVVVAAACSSSGNPSANEAGDGGNSADTGSASNDDAGSTPLSDAACSPASVQSYAPRWTPPKPHTSSCTVAQIASYTACVASGESPTSAACAPWLGANALPANTDCRTCFTASSSTDSAWGPVVDTSALQQINVAGCMALVAGDTGGTGCAGQYEALQGCESAACATNCTNATSSALKACTTAADDTGCSSLLSAASCVNDAGAAEECFGPPGADFAQVLTAVGSVFCLETEDAGSTADAGSTDAGAVDSGGASDAGDGG